MKDKILILIIGILIGAIIATGGFLIYRKISNNNQDRPGMMQMDENRQGGPQFNENMNEPPAKPQASDSSQSS